MFRHPFPCNCWSCRQYSEWVKKQDFGPTEEQIKHIKKRIEEIKHKEETECQKK